MRCMGLLATIVNAPHKNSHLEPSADRRAGPSPTKRVLRIACHSGPPAARIVAVTWAGVIRDRLVIGTAHPGSVVMAAIVSASGGVVLTHGSLQRG